MDNKPQDSDFLSEQDVMHALRELLVGPEKEKIVELEQHINEVAHPVATVEDIAHALPEAIRLRMAQDKNLQHALQPLTEQAIQTSVLNNPKPLSEALFPIMGPAIRKSINHTINSMLQSMNQALENSFSIQGLRWRIEAQRSGKSFAEIVMLNTLLYRVEQVFVIHRESGLLITHLATDARMEEDADLVSSMLTAVRDFVRDSFAPNSEDEIDNLRMGELELLIGQSPHITLAVVCRGNIPHELYTMIDEHLEALQQEYAHSFAGFNGDTTPFEGMKNMLRDLMVSDYKIKEKRKRKPVRALIVIALLMLPLIGWWGWSHYQQQQWLTFIQTLRQTEGVAVLYEGKEHGHYVLHGLLDPMATEPRSLMPSRLPLNKVEMHWRPYYSLEDTMVLKRAVHLLKPDAETTLSFAAGVLTMRGAAHEPWIRTAAEQALRVPGVLQTDIQLRNMDLETLDHKVHRLLSPPDSVQLILENDSLKAQGEALQQWQNHARQAVSTITELRSYDDSTLLVLDSPAHLLAQAKALLQPPSTVTLSVDSQRVLSARGQALTAWLEGARQKAVGISYLASFNHRNLELLDSPAYLQKMAQTKLQPPDSVSLTVSKDRVLTARGEANPSWVAKSRKLAATIPYIQRYDDDGIIDPFDRARILRLARQKLSPPASVKLDYRNGRLYAGGQASTAWIERARQLAPKIRGVSVYDDRQLSDPEMQWQAMRNELRAIHIVFQSGTGRINGAEEYNKIRHVRELFAKAASLIQSSRLQVIGVSSLYGERANQVAHQRAVAVTDQLTAQGINPYAIIEQTQVVRDDRWGVAFDVLH